MTAMPEVVSPGPEIVGRYWLRPRQQLAQARGAIQLIVPVVFVIGLTGAAARSHEGRRHHISQRRKQGMAQKSAKSTTAIDKTSAGFTAEERAAMKERAKELKAEARAQQEQGGRGKRRAREDRRDAGTGSRHGRAAPCDHQSQRASPLAEDLVRDARVCQGRQGRLLLHACAEVQLEVRDVRLQRRRRTSTTAPCGRPPSR